MLPTVSAFFRLAWVILKINRQNTTKLFAELNHELAKNGFALSETHRKRIAFYTAQSAITNHWFCLLRDAKPNATEVQNALYLGAFTPIADDLMDAQNLTFESLLAQKSATPDGVLFAFLYQKLQPQLLQNQLFKTYFEKAHAAQNQSLKQLQKEPLTIEELKKISFDKGGFYTTLYRMVLQNKPVAGEEAAIYTLGAIMQLLNDLFDIHKDYHNGVQTLATNTRNIHFMQAELAALESKFLAQYLALDYPQNAKKKSLAAIFAIVTRGHVALQFYQNLQGKNAQLEIANRPRKSLIVDMEKPVNVWKNLVATNRVLKNIKKEIKSSKLQG